MKYHEIEFKPVINFRIELVYLMFEEALRQEEYSEELYNEFKDELFLLIKVINQHKTTWSNFIFKFRAKNKIQKLFIKVYETPYQK